MSRSRYVAALLKAQARESEHALINKDYPKHTTGVARWAFAAGAAWNRRYLARVRRS